MENAANTRVKASATQGANVDRACRTVAENLETLLRTAREQNEAGIGLPKYVEQEF
jgi:hypothetical protein